MFPLLRSLTVRYLLQKWDRSLLVTLSIALGVATLVSSRLLNQCVDAAALDTTIPVDVADLYVTTGEHGVDWSVADDLQAARIPGVARVERFVYMRVDLPQVPDQHAVLFGQDLAAAASSADTTSLTKLKVSIEWKANPLLLAGRGIMISRRIYEERSQSGFKDSDPVEVKYTEKPTAFALVGVVDVAKDSPMAPYAGTLLVTNVQVAAQILHPASDAGGGRVSRVNLFLDKGTDVDGVRQAAQAVVGPRASVRTAEENRKSTHEVIGGVKLVLNLCSIGALVVGLFLVYNALAVTVAERRHDIGVLRSLGATRGQIAGLFTVEAVVLGALGSLPGVPLGMGLADLAIRLFGDELSSAFMNAGESFRPQLSVGIVALALAGGMLTSLLAALIPSLQAASDEPADAVRRAPSGSARGIRWAHRATCIVLVAAGALTVLWRRYLPSRTGSMVGLSLILTGLFLAMPIFAGLLARLLHAPCRWLLGVESRLAADNLIRSPARTGVVIGALAAGVALMFQTAGVGKSNEVPIRNWLEEVIRADAFVFRGNPVSANSSMTPMEPEIRDDLQRLPGVERVVGLRFNRIEYGGTYILMVGIDAVDYQRGVLERGRPDSPALEKMEQLPEGDYTIVSDNFAAKWNVREGDTITVKSPRGDVQLKVIGIGRDYSWSMGTVFVDRVRYAELFGDRRIDAFHVFFRPDADFDTTYEAVQKYSEREGLLVQNRESVYIYLAGVLERIFQIAYLQQVIVSVVATLGVVMALLISVLQRRRELGLLRAVGATQPQVIKSVLAEATLMGILGTVLGFLMGLPMEWYLLRVVLQEETGFVFDVLIPWKQALGIGLISVLTATLAGLVPAIHAARLRIPDAIAYE
jgi:putative ABC transport system permease protein